MTNEFIPVMSATGARYITNKLLERASLKKQYFIFEYGAGHSTKFFTDRLIEKHIAAHYVAVERDPTWYAEIQKLFPNGKLVKHPWSFKDYFAFIKAKPQNVWDVPEECRRLRGEQRRMLSPKNILKLLLHKNNFWFDASYEAAIGHIHFECVYVYEAFKDQYGESPNKNKYIRIPLEGLKRALESKQKCHAVFIIDGGPRADIVKEVFSLIDTYPNLTADIFLLEAYRGYYRPILSSRSDGRFIAAGKNEMLNGGEYLEKPKGRVRASRCTKLMGESNISEVLEKELWHFTNT